MPIAHFLIIWIHLVAAISWIGGMIFLSLVLAPLVRSRKAAPEFMALFRSSARRFRFVVWAAIALLLSTGPILLHQRGLSLFDPVGWPDALRIKLGLVGLFLVLAFAHDLLLGPRVSKISSIPESARSSWDQMLLRTATWLPRVALVVALAIVLGAVVLART